MRTETKGSFKGSMVLSSVIGYTTASNWIQILSGFTAIDRHLWFTLFLINIICIITYWILWLRHHK